MFFGISMDSLETEKHSNLLIIPVNIRIFKQFGILAGSALEYAL